MSTRGSNELAILSVVPRRARDPKFPGSAVVIGPNCVHCRRMRRVLALLTILGLAGCATPRAARGTEASAPLDSSQAPSTALDPPPYTPPPSEAGEAHRDARPIGLVTSGSEERARVLAIRFVRAIRDSDATELERALDARVARIQPRLGRPSRPREAVVEQLLHHPRRRGFGSATRLEEIIDVEQTVARPLADAPRAGDVPAGLRPTDLLVTIPLRRTGRRVLRHLVPGWNQTATLLVRPGSSARIVGL